MAKTTSLPGLTGRSGPIIGVSWPRSGHHMLVRLLQIYFGPDFGYCDFYGGKPWVDDIDTCCGQVPCTHAERIWLTKSHDFTLDLPQIPNQKYLIQYRDFAPSVVSNFELFVRNGGSDTPMSFRIFASGEFTRYLGFLRRWVQSDFAQDQLLLNYSTFLEDPHTELTRAVAFIRPDRTVDTDAIAQAISEVDGEEVKQGRVRPLQKSGVHSERNLSDFRYYTPALERELKGLRLSRREVMDAFQITFERAPAEANMLRFQGYESSGALIEELKASDEYRHRRSTAPKSDT